MPPIPGIATRTGGLTLGANNTVQGLDLGNAVGAALSGTNVGTAAVNTVTTGQIDNQTGAAAAVTTGTLNAAFSAVMAADDILNAASRAVGNTSSSVRLNWPA